MTRAAAGFDGAPGIRLAADTFGDSDAPAVLMLHGGGLGLACGGVPGRDQLAAYKTAPCGTLITLTYAGRSLTVPVIDRGPYIAGREWT